MGIFKKKFKPGKTYNVLEAKEILKREGFENYVAQEVAGGYKLVDESKRQNNNQKEEFRNRISGNGSYRNKEFVPCQYNSAKTNTKTKWKPIGR